MFLYHIWCDILERTNKVNNLLQSSGLLLQAVVDNMMSLFQYVQILRKEFNHYGEKALETVNAIASIKMTESDDDQVEIATEVSELCYKRQIRIVVKRKKEFDEGAGTEHSLSPQEELRTQTFLAICDTLSIELTKRTVNYRRIDSDFSFLFEYNSTFADKVNGAKKITEKY